MKAETGTKIVRLTAENVKRLRAVEIKPDGAVVQITGRNGQGKTSVLDAIEMALGGAKAIPQRPIRDGEDSARVVLELDDLIVKRTFTPGGTYLAVESKDGARYSRPQDVLDKLVGRLTFDPLAFARMDPKKQSETLRLLVGLDFTAIDGKRAKAYEDRTQVNRELKAKEAQLAAMPEVDAPDEEVSVAELAKRLEVARRRQADVDVARRAVQLGFEQVIKAKAKIEELRKALECANKELAEAEAQVNKYQRELETYQQTQAPSVEDVVKEMATVEQTNAKVRARKTRDAVEMQVLDLRVKSEDLTAKITELDNEKAAALENAAFPVPGLSFDDEGVIYNDVPFAQASAAEQLRVSVAIGLAMNPKLRVLLIRDGSLLDSESLQMIAGMAEAAGAQVWMERVSDGEPVGVVIEDGEVKEVANG